MVKQFQLFGKNGLGTFLPENVAFTSLPSQFCFHKRSQIFQVWVTVITVACQILDTAYGQNTKSNNCKLSLSIKL